MFFSTICCDTRRPTVCVTCVWAGVDNVWEQEKLEARKTLENAAESHTSGARFVGTLLTLRLIDWVCIKLPKRLHLDYPSNTVFRQLLRVLDNRRLVMIQLVSVLVQWLPLHLR